MDADVPHLQTAGCISPRLLTEPVSPLLPHRPHHRSGPRSGSIPRSVHEPPAWPPCLQALAVLSWALHQTNSHKTQPGHHGHRPRPSPTQPLLPPLLRGRPALPNWVRRVPQTHSNPPAKPYPPRARPRQALLSPPRARPWRLPRTNLSGREHACEVPSPPPQSPRF